MQMTIKSTRVSSSVVEAAASTVVATASAAEAVSTEQAAPIIITSIGNTGLRPSLDPEAKFYSGRTPVVSALTHRKLQEKDARRLFLEKIWQRDECKMREARERTSTISLQEMMTFPRNEWGAYGQRKDPLSEIEQRESDEGYLTATLEARATEEALEVTAEEVTAAVDVTAEEARVERATTAEVTTKGKMATEEEAEAEAEVEAKEREEAKTKEQAKAKRKAEARAKVEAEQEAEEKIEAEVAARTTIKIKRTKTSTTTITTIRMPVEAEATPPAAIQRIITQLTRAEAECDPDEKSASCFKTRWLPFSKLKEGVDKKRTFLHTAADLQALGLKVDSVGPEPSPATRFILACSPYQKLTPATHNKQSLVLEKRKVEKHVELEKNNCDYVVFDPEVHQPLPNIIYVHDSDDESEEVAEEIKPKQEKELRTFKQIIRKEGEDLGLIPTQTTEILYPARGVGLEAVYVLPRERDQDKLMDHLQCRFEHHLERQRKLQAQLQPRQPLPEAEAEASEEDPLLEMDEEKMALAAATIAIAAKAAKAAWRSAVSAATVAVRAEIKREEEKAPTEEGKVTTEEEKATTEEGKEPETEAEIRKRKRAERDLLKKEEIEEKRRREGLVMVIEAPKLLKELKPVKIETEVTVEAESLRRAFHDPAKKVVSSLPVSVKRLQATPRTPVHPRIQSSGQSRFQPVAQGQPIKHSRVQAVTQAGVQSVKQKHSQFKLLTKVEIEVNAKIDMRKAQKKAETIAQHQQTLPWPEDKKPIESPLEMMVFCPKTNQRLQITMPKHQAVKVHLPGPEDLNIVDAYCAKYLTSADELFFYQDKHKDIYLIEQHFVEQASLTLQRQGQRVKVLGDEVETISMMQYRQRQNKKEMAETWELDAVGLSSGYCHTLSVSTDQKLSVYSLSADDLEREPRLQEYCEKNRCSLADIVLFEAISSPNKSLFFARKSAASPELERVIVKKSQLVCFGIAFRETQTPEDREMERQKQELMKKNLLSLSFDQKKNTEKPLLKAKIPELLFKDAVFKDLVLQDPIPPVVLDAIEAAVVANEQPSTSKGEG